MGLWYRRSCCAHDRLNSLDTLVLATPVSSKLIVILTTRHQAQGDRRARQ